MERHDSYTASVVARWNGAGITDAPLTIYGGRAGEVAVKVGGGQARLPRYGEPLSAHAPGFRLLGDWDKLNTGHGPGEWVCSAERVDEG